MCGIVGYLGSPRPQGEAELWLTNRRDRMRHRGPDDQGCWVSPDGSVGLGHRRLSILDLSPEGHQPMASVGGRYQLVFNGEIYNFPELRQQLRNLGHGFRGGSDTEVMLAAFLQWGVAESLPRFTGMFAFALWDLEKRELTLARDHYGKKPLYYGQVDGSWVFASELKALHCSSLELDRSALASYFRFGYVPAPSSIYRQLRKLPAASLVTLRAGEAEAKPVPFWSLSDLARAPRKPPSLGEVESCLRAAVQRRMVSDVPLGAFLSGGVDSSLIVCLMQQLSTQPVQTFCIGFEERSHDESPYARAVAQHLGTHHTEHLVTAREALDVVPLLPRLYDEPFADSSQIPTYLVSALARQQVTVALSGDGGDEVFGGYNRYVWGPPLWSALSWVPLALRQLLFQLCQRISVERLARFVPRVAYPQDKLTKLLQLLRVQLPSQLYGSLVSQWDVPVVLGAREALSRVDSFHWSGDFRSSMMELDALTYLPDDILVKVDRASMGVSLECRAPFLDPEVAALAWSLPNADKVRGRIGKRILRELLAKYLPARILERPKAGFSLPLGQWLRGPLRPWAEDLLGSDRLRRQGLLEGELIQQRWKQHVSGQRNWSAALWCVLMFQAWSDEWQV